GVVLVFVPHLAATGAHGATRWLGYKAVVQMSVRCAWADIFWFTLFHELGHILLHSRKEVFVEGVSDPTSPEEVEANRFAADALIPPADLARLTTQPNISGAAVRAFAAGIGIAPGIVVGRLQHERLLDRSELNGLRQRLKLVKASN